MAAGAWAPRSGSGYWSLPRTKDFSMLVHSTWDDARFYGYFRFNRWVTVKACTLVAQRFSCFTSLSVSQTCCGLHRARDWR